ncbi:MAG: hypothetical protein WD470_00305 [Rhodospirillaceae bacterium]
MKWIVYGFATGIAAVLLPAGPAASQGTINIFPCEGIPEGARMRVEVLDDSTPMLRIRDTLLTALQDRGFRASDEAGVVLSIETELERRIETRKERDLGSVTASTDGDILARTNLWSRGQDSVIAGRKDIVLSEAREEIRLSLFINRVSDGRCLWRADAFHDTAGRDHWSVAEKTVPVLVDAIGTDARRIEFGVD